MLAGSHCELDFLDVHIYPWGGSAEVHAPAHERDAVIQAGKPAMVGEYGVFKDKPIEEAKGVLKQMLEQAYAMGYRGDLHWVWDLTMVPGQTWSSVEEGLEEFVMALTCNTESASTHDAIRIEGVSPSPNARFPLLAFSVEAPWMRGQLVMRSPETQPLHHVISQLVYAASTRQVTDVWIAGKQLLDGGELTTIDIDELMDSAGKWHTRLAWLENQLAGEAKEEESDV